MTDPNQQIFYPLLVRFEKAGMMRFVGHLDWLAMQQAMYLRAGLPMGKGEGPTQRMKIKTSPPTPVGVASRAEFTYVMLSEPVTPEEAGRRLESHCPEGVGVIYVKDAGFMIRKNPFATIEASEYTVDFGDVSEEKMGKIVELLNIMKSNEVEEGVEKEEVKGFWGRIMEIERADGRVRLLVWQMEGDTFHGAKCALYMEKRLGLEHYPMFVKMDYFRMKPSKRKLYR
jgi:radical SAM-linked protein